MFAYQQQLFNFISNFRQVIIFVAMSHQLLFLSPQIQKQIRPEIQSNVMLRAQEILSDCI